MAMEALRAPYKVIAMVKMLAVFACYKPHLVIIKKYFCSTWRPFCSKQSSPLKSYLNSKFPLKLLSMF